MTQELGFDIKDISLIIINAKKTARFPIGELVITRNAADTLDHRCWLNGLRRHMNGDWGEVCEEDRGLNDEALKNQERLLSVYRDRNGEKYWIITEWDRSLTTILLPDDY